MAVFNNVSVDDVATGPYSPNWSNPTWTVQTLISAAIVTATGGTYV